MGSFTWPADELVLHVYLQLFEFPLLQKLLLCWLQVWKLALLFQWPDAQKKAQFIIYDIN
jgi:hypothetical protein